jgi:uncharacterized membrane protein YdjX (TVP38/TMEM64 family)
MRVWRWLLLGTYLTLIAGLAWLWHDPQTQQWFNQDALTAWGRQMLDLPLGPLLVLAGYVVLVMLGMPVLVLITVGTLIFSPWPGMAYAMAGMLSGAMVTYGVGRFTGGEAMDRWTSGRASRLARLTTHLRQRGLLAVVVVRVLPVAPFIMVNLLAGALRVRWRHYVLGTFLGLLPATIFIPLMLGQASAAWKAPSARSLAALLAAIGVAVAVSWGLRVWLRRRMGKVAEAS